MTDTSDPVLVQRHIVRRRVSLGLRAGSALFLVATVLFFWAVITDFTEFLTTIITVCLLVGSLLLAPAMVFHYGVKAADRADREDSW